MRLLIEQVIAMLDSPPSLPAGLDRLDNMSFIQVYDAFLDRWPALGNQSDAQYNADAIHAIYYDFELRKWDKARTININGLQGAIFICPTCNQNTWTFLAGHASLSHCRECCPSICLLSCRGCLARCETLCDNSRCSLCCVAARGCECCADRCCHENWQRTLFQQNPLAFHGAKPNEFIHLRSKRYVAVEIECGVRARPGNLHEVIAQYSGSIVHDGSVSCTNPIEINTPPASGDKFYKILKEITDALRQGRAEVNDSCGLHIHVDARDMTWYDIRKLLLLYSKVEPALYSLVPTQRRENSYCVPCRDFYTSSLGKIGTVRDLKKEISKKCYGGRKFKDVKNDKYGSTARYNSLNLHSWVHRGSIEFRLPPGSTNFEKIMHWARLFSGLVDAANKLTEKRIVALDGAPMVILKQIIPNDHGLHEWLDKRTRKFGMTNFSALQAIRDGRRSRDHDEDEDYHDDYGDED